MSHNQAGVVALLARGGSVELLLLMTTMTLDGHILWTAG